MNILNTILSKVMPWVVKPEAAAAAPPVASASTGSATSVNTTTPTVPQHVDVDEILTGIERRGSQQLNWRSSIVDLMKMLDMDSDLASRRQLAKELNYTGDVNDSATMNVWLHKQVMRKLEENGGKIPESMKH